MAALRRVSQQRTSDASWRSARRRSLSFSPAWERRRQRFEVHAVNLGETMSGKIDDGPCLFKGYVAEQRLVATIDRRHVDEEYLRENLAERPEPQQDRAADVARHDSLARGLDVHGVIDGELAEARSPRVRQREIRRTRVDQDIADDPATWVRAVFDGCFDDYSTHAGFAVLEDDIRKAYRLTGIRSLDNRLGNGPNTGPVQPPAGSGRRARLTHPR